MSKIRSKNTKFEQNFILTLKKKIKKGFKTNVSAMRGKPDIVFAKYHLCIFLDSDFWHGWQYPRWKHLLKNDFWRTKIEKNRKRDRLTTQKLKKQGWKILRFWEHQLKTDNSKAIKKIANFLENT